MFVGIKKKKMNFLSVNIAADWFYRWIEVREEIEIELTIASFPETLIFILFLLLHLSFFFFFLGFLSIWRGVCAKPVVEFFSRLFLFLWIVFVNKFRNTTIGSIHLWNIFLDFRNHRFDNFIFLSRYSLQDLIKLTFEHFIIWVCFLFKL